MRQGCFIQRTPFDLPIILLLVAGLIGIYASADRGVSWGAYQSLLACVLLYYSFANCSRPKLLVIVALPLAVVGILVIGGYVFLQVPTSLPFFSQLQTWIHPELLSCPEGWSKPPLAASACGVTVAVEVVTMMVAGIALFPGKKVTRIVCAVITLLLLMLLVISGCHATWVMLAVGMLFLLVWRSRWFLLSLPAWVGIVFWSVTTRAGISLQQGMDTVSSLLEYRYHRWEVIWHMLADYPLTGCGLGCYPSIFHQYTSGYGNIAHNAYLQFYCDFGLLGAIALIGAGGVYLRLMWRVWHSSPSHPWYSITVGIGAAILLAAAYSVVESAPACILAMGTDSYYYVISPMFLALAGVLVAAYQQLKKSDNLRFKTGEQT